MTTSDTFPISIAIGSAIAVFTVLATLLATFFTVEQRTAAIVQRLGKFVQEAGPGTTAKDVMNLVLMTQYFDTLKEIGASSRSNAILIPHSPGSLASPEPHEDPEPLPAGRISALGRKLDRDRGDDRTGKASIRAVRIRNRPSGRGLEGRSATAIQSSNSCGSGAVRPDPRRRASHASSMLPPARHAVA